VGQFESTTLLLHTSFGSSIPDWHSLGYVDGLNRDYQLILVDPRGQGHSDTPHSTQDYSPGHRVADVIAVLDALGFERVHFWGLFAGRACRV
jgi:pimeloyl-ACP methyl ester carboxylesterase